MRIRQGARLMPKTPFRPVRDSGITRVVSPGTAWVTASHSEETA